MNDLSGLIDVESGSNIYNLPAAIQGLEFELGGTDSDTTTSRVCRGTVNLDDLSQSYYATFNNSSTFRDEYVENYCGAVLKSTGAYWVKFKVTDYDEPNLTLTIYADYADSNYPVKIKLRFKPA